MAAVTPYQYRGNKWLGLVTERLFAGFSAAIHFGWF
jgi:hypothetical protein